MAERNKKMNVWRDIRNKSDAFPCTATMPQAKKTMMAVRKATARLLSTPCTPILPKMATSAAKKAERTAYHAQFIAREQLPASRSCSSPPF